MPVRIEMLPVYIAIGISAILAVSASFMRLLTVPAAITAAVMLTAAAVFWGFTGMTLYLALFALSSLIGAIGGKRRKERVMRIHKRTGARKVVQVLANGLPALVMAAIWFFTGLVPFKVAAAASLAAGFADSVAGDVGVLSRGKTVSVLGFRRVERGMSGGITLAGSIATVLASALGAAIPAFFGEYGAALADICASGGRTVFSSWHKELESAIKWMAEFNNREGLRRPARMPGDGKTAEGADFDVLVSVENPGEDLMTPLFEGCNGDGSLNLLLNEESRRRFYEDERPGFEIVLGEADASSAGQLAAFVQISEGIAEYFGGDEDDN